jgi:hypothetical protein
MSLYEYHLVETVPCVNCGSETYPTADVHDWDEEFCVGCIHEGVVVG